MQWWDDHDEGWTERDDGLRRHLIALVGVLIATAIIVYVAS